MKLKCLPDDFRVEELIGELPPDGPFALYRLTKSTLGTLEAIGAVAEHWKLDLSQLAFAGLKDRHAVTSQYVTIRGGPRRGFRQLHLTLQYVAQVRRPIHARDILANRFRIVLRDMAPEEAGRAAEALKALKRNGLPNYFDSQRFGSVGASGDFIARPWCLGDYERALWLATADPNDRDRPDDRRNKRVLADGWGRWAECAAALPPSLAGQVASFLADRPGDYKRALTLIPHELRSLYLAAYQSDVWNRWLAAVLRAELRPDQWSLVPIGRRELPFFRGLDESQQAHVEKLVLPLPSARLHLEDGPRGRLLAEVLAEDGLELRQMRVKYPRDTFFSKGERAAVMRPRELSLETSADELHADRRKLTLEFSLPRGSYATLIVKPLGATGLAEEEDRGA
jgi:tRNA pseudouridine13 synthase